MKRGSSGLSTGFPGLWRQFLCATTMLSVLCLVSCGSTKAAARAETKRAEASSLQSNVALRLVSGPDGVTPETASLRIPVSAIQSLPEGAEYSHQKGNTRATIRREPGDSLLVSATGLTGLHKPLSLELDAGGIFKRSDTLLSRSDASDAPLPRGQPEKNSGNTRELLFIAVIILVLIGMIAYESHKHQKQ